MADTTSGTNISIGRLILVPSLITLAITILRVVGELRHWSNVLFNANAGGGGAIVGIAWLPFIFGPYFALKLADAGAPYSSAGKAVGFALLGLVVMIAGRFVGFSPMIKLPGKEILGLVLFAVGAAIPYAGWPALSKTLLAYGYAARIPVAVLMFFAIQGNWGTHYDAVPPNYTGPSDPVPKWLFIGVLPQLIFWVAYAVVLGSLLGGIVASIARRGRAAAATAT
jgi:hypothetical protein